VISRTSHARDANHPDIVVQRFLSHQHDVSRFFCGNASLDAYLQDTLARDEAHHAAVAYTFVRAADTAALRRVIGYFTLSSFSLAKRQARRRDRDKYLGGYDPVPAVLIGRLALNREFQGQGLGGALVTAALFEIRAIRERLGVSAAVVHAIDEAAAQFYEHQGFTRFRDEPSHLYFPLAAFEATFAQS
jgi:GNAT superfamily N-acetyltransferase